MFRKSSLYIIVITQNFKKAKKEKKTYNKRKIERGCIDLGLIIC